MTLPRLVLTLVAAAVAATVVLRRDKPGTLLVELVAWVGDRVGYYQDRIANEGFVATARKSVPVRRHGQLLDYELRPASE